jgi:Glu-tRNA(Gln) amidotransferase subunit E-like FAD-binding protein
MIVELQLSLEGQAIGWYAQQDISTFMMFQELVDKFEELLQVKIDPTVVLKEYYSLQQQAGESIAKVLLQFHAVQALLDTAPTEDIQKRQFLKALKEPLRSSFALLDFSTVPLMEVVNMALNLDHQ